MSRHSLVALLVALLGCGPKPPPVRPLPGEEACDAADRRLTELECKDDRGRSYSVNAAGTHFAEACRRAMADGRDWHPACLARVPDCSGVTRAFTQDSCPFPVVQP